ncbi:MAG: hypothetical protein ACFFC7_10875, partial [Candidatus Hermodarchaeota archaeon]
MRRLWIKNAKLLVIISLTIVVAFNPALVTIGQLSTSSTPSAPSKAKLGSKVPENRSTQTNILVIDGNDRTVALAVTTLHKALNDFHLQASQVNIDDFSSIYLSTKIRFAPSEDLIIVAHGSPIGLQGSNQLVSWQKVQNLLSKIRCRYLILLACYSDRGIPYSLRSKGIGFNGFVDAEGGALYAAVLLASNFNMMKAQAHPLMQHALVKQRDLCHPLVETITINGRDVWLYGLNYAWAPYQFNSTWLNDSTAPGGVPWGRDESTFKYETEADFHAMSLMGAHVVRMTLTNIGDDFINIWNNGTHDIIVGFHKGVIARLDWVLRYLCPKYDILLILNIFTGNFAFGSNRYQECFNNYDWWRDDFVYYAGELARLFPSQSYQHLLAWETGGEIAGNDLDAYNTDTGEAWGAWDYYNNNNHTQGKNESA